MASFAPPVSGEVFISPDAKVKQREQEEIIKGERRLEEVLAKSSHVIYEVSSVFPLDFFPDKIIIREEKIDIVKGLFFFSKQMFPILIKSMTGVKVSHNLLFATMEFEVKGYEENPQPVHYLWIEEAMRAKRIITGLIVCDKERIKLPPDLSASELASKLDEIGRAREPS